MKTNTIDKKLKELYDLNDKLIQAEEDFALVLELSIDLVCIIDNKTNFIMVSKSFSDLLGYTKEELLSTSYLNIIKESDRASTILASESLNIGNVIDFKNTLISKYGEEFTVSWRANSYILGRSLAIGRVIFKSDKSPNT